MIVNAKIDVTWEAAPKTFAFQSEKKIKRTLKELIGADDVDILDWNIFDDEEDSWTNHTAISKINKCQGISDNVSDVRASRR